MRPLLPCAASLFALVWLTASTALAEDVPPTNPPLPAPPPAAAAPAAPPAPGPAASAAPQEGQRPASEASTSAVGAAPETESVFRSVIIDNLLGFTVNGYGTTLTSPFRINVYAGDVQSVGIAPDLHFMVTDNVTLGFRSSFGASRAFSVGNVSVPTSSKLLFAFDFVPTLGYVARLNRSFSLWPNGGIGVKFMGDNRDDRVGIRADFEVPLVVNIVRNMYLALGPGITIQKELTKNSSGSSITGSPSDVMFALGVNGRVGLTF